MIALSKNLTACPSLHTLICPLKSRLKWDALIFAVGKYMVLETCFYAPRYGREVYDYVMVYKLAFFCDSDITLAWILTNGIIFEM